MVNLVTFSTDNIVCSILVRYVLQQKYMKGDIKTRVVRKFRSVKRIVLKQSSSPVVTDYELAFRCTAQV